MIAGLEWVEQAAWSGGMMGGAVLAALGAHFLLFVLLRRSFRAAHRATFDLLRGHCYRPARWFAVVMAVRMAPPLTPLPPAVGGALTQFLSILVILTFAGFFMSLAHVGRDLLLRRYRVTEGDNLRARQITTQLRIANRIFTAIVLAVVAGCILMTFDQVRQLGVSLLASAGVVGIVAGFAAQRALASLISGLQLAITQPIRLDDMVVVEGEGGRIEEITLTYVVVRTWDLRRLIVPVSYFIEKPFQNWTRTSAELLGTVVLHADYTVPVDAVRRELERAVRTSTSWDRKTWGLQVTNITEHTVEMTATVSAANASALGSLRCEVREKLLGFLQSH